MKKNITCILIALGIIFFSCKSNKILSIKTPLHTIDTNFVLQKIHNTQNFIKKISLKANIEAKMENKNINFKAYIRIIKDSAIWVSVQFASLEMARIIILSDSIFIIDRKNKKIMQSAIEKYQPSYFIHYDLPLLQNLLLGNYIIIPNKKSMFFYDNGDVITKNITSDLYISQYYSYPNYELTKIQIFNSKNEKNNIVEFEKFTEISEQLIPQIIHVTSAYKNIQNNATYTIKYTNIKINENINISFRKPKKYEIVPIK